MLHAIASAFLGVATFISSLFGAAPAPLQAPAPQTLGAALPSGTAVFETSLQSRISATDASMALVSNSVRGGSSLSGYNCFTVDEGRTDAEYVCGTVSSTSVTSLTRGIDPANGTSSNSALKFAHRVGANVKITDFPLLQILRNQANGSDTYEHALTYASGVTPANTGDLTDKEYVDGLAFSGAGVVDASALSRGVVELATGAEAAASTASGSSGTLAIPASLATTTYNSATAANRVPVTNGSGKIDSYFLSTSTLFAYSLPAAKGASSTVLMTDGSGAVTWEGVSTLLSASSTPGISLGGGTASTTLVLSNSSGSTVNGRGPLQFTVRNAGSGSQRMVMSYFGPSATVGARPPLQHLECPDYELRYDGNPPAIVMATAYKDPAEAQAGLTAALAPTNDSQKAAIANAAALVPGAPAAAPAPIQRTIDPGADAADKYLGSFKAPETADQIAERLRQGSQGSIDAINTVYDDKVKANQAIGQERLAQDNAISVLSGLTGSTEAGRTRGAALEKNDKEVQAINNERLMKTQAVYSQISQQALDEARAQREDATADANAIVARRKDAQARTLDSLKAIAAGGLVDFDSFKSSPQNAEVYAHALDAMGGSEQALRGVFAANRPQDQLVGTPTRVGDHFIQAYQNPLTGKISYDKVEVPGGLPTEYNQKIGDSLVAIPDGWDGDTSKLKVIAGGSSDGGGVPGDNPQLYAGLSAKTATAVRAQVAAFKSEPAVQNFSVIQEGRNFAGSLSNTTKNPTDDQGLIYALAKAMDPGSVVREGEYATAQKYAQSLIDSYGKGVTQAINGTGFLTEKARTQIKDTIEARYKASLGSYTHLEKQYQTGIDNLTGRDDGAKFVRDYQTSGGSSGGTDADPLGIFN